MWFENPVHGVAHGDGLGSPKNQLLAQGRRWKTVSPYVRLLKKWRRNYTVAALQVDITEHKQWRLIAEKWMQKSD